MPWGARSKEVTIFGPQTRQRDNFSGVCTTNPKLSGCVCPLIWEFRFSAKNGQNLRKLAACGVKNLTKNFTKMAENWSFFDKKLAFFSQNPLEPILAPKQFWKSYDQFRPIFRQNGQGCNLNFAPKPFLREFL